MPEQLWSLYSKDKDVVAFAEPALYDLEKDIAETTDVAPEHPEVVKELMKHIEWARNDIGDHNRVGKNARFFDPEPRRSVVKKKVRQKGK